MSHFSKIKTNISNISILKKTIDQLGLYCKEQNLSSTKNLVVYSDINKLNPLFSFVSDEFEYNLIVDLQFWSLDMDFNCFMDKLSQRYAYNVILDKSLSTGFKKINEKISLDGSIKVTVTRWSDCF